MDPIVLNPEVTFAAIGALGGILLTIVTQLLNSTLQRRSDRALKTYETRLEIFTEFWFTVDRFSHFASLLRPLQDNPDLQTFLNQGRIRDEGLAAADRIEAALNANPPPSADEAAQLRADARDEAERLTVAQASIERAGPQMAKLQKKLTGAQEEVSELQQNLRRLGFKLQLISSSDRVNDSIAKMTNRLEAGEALKPDDYAEFREVAAEHVGLRRKDARRFRRR